MISWLCRQPVCPALQDPSSPAHWSSLVLQGGSQGAGLVEHPVSHRALGGLQREAPPRARRVPADSWGQGGDSSQLGEGHSAPPDAHAEPPAAGEQKAEGVEEKQICWVAAWNPGRTSTHQHPSGHVSLDVFFVFIIKHPHGHLSIWFEHGEIRLSCIRQQMFSFNREAGSRLCNTSSVLPLSAPSSCLLC